MKSLSQRDFELIWHPCSQMKDYEELPPIVIARGEGLFLYDSDGRRYADVISSWWCNLLGHCNPRISAAVKTQLDKLEHVIFANFTHEPAVALCDALAELLPKGLGKFFFTDNGSSSVEVAMKMSFQYHHQTGNPQKIRFMALSGAYHGETVGALSAGGVDLYSKLYQPMLLDVIHVDGPDCYRCRYHRERETCNAECFEAAERALKEHGHETCAFLAEPIVQGAAGMRIYPPQYLKKLRDACHAQNVHLIADEIAMGFGRTGRMFACEHADISPDFICLSKGLTGGYLPMALAVTTEKIYDAFYADYSQGKTFPHSHTYCGNPLACSAALEVLGILKEDRVLDQARKKANLFRELVDLEFRGHPFVGDLRSIGLINAIELVTDKKRKTPIDSSGRISYEIYKRALKNGLILRPINGILYFNPPLTITEEEMALVVRAARKSVDEILL